MSASTLPPPDDRDADDDRGDDDDRKRRDRDEGARAAEAKTRLRNREQGQELAALKDARPGYAGYIHDAPLAGVLLFGLATEDLEPLSGVLRALRGDVSALVVLADDQEEWGLLTPTLENIERRLEVALELRRREIEGQQAK